MFNGPHRCFWSHLVLAVRGWAVTAVSCEASLHFSGASNVILGWTLCTSVWSRLLLEKSHIHLHLEGCGRNVGSALRLSSLFWTITPEKLSPPPYLGRWNLFSLICITQISVAKAATNKYTNEQQLKRQYLPHALCRQVELVCSHLQYPDFSGKKLLPINIPMSRSRREKGGILCLSSLR